MRRKEGDFLAKTQKYTLVASTSTWFCLDLKFAALSNLAKPIYCLNVP